MEITEGTILSEIIPNFCLDCTVADVKKFGNGHINDTFLIETHQSGKTVRYTLQRINSNVFKKPLEVMSNMVNVTDFLREKLAGTDCGERRCTVSVIRTRDGEGCYKDSENMFWRLYKYIDDAVSLDLPETEEDFYQSAYAFGEFQRLLNDFPADSLYETIPDFHNTPVRYQNFINAVNRDRCGRRDGVMREIEFVKQREAFTHVLMDAQQRGEIPLRVTHNDTKMNNVLLDRKTRKQICVIDLDTIMPGLSVTDFGDSIRFGASTAAEDEKNLDKVHFDISLFEAYLNGYMDGCGGQLTDNEIELLPEGAKMMTIECGMRFLTDYLEGDTYFRTAYPEHNLDRCRTQFKLVYEMEQNWDKMKELVRKFKK